MSCKEYPRRVLGVLIFALAGLAFIPRPVRADELQITHGPILGRLDADRVGIWARTSRPGAFRVRCGLTPDQLQWVSDEAATLLARDNTGWVLIDGLKSNTKYFYELEIPGGAASSETGGSFRTLPGPGDFRHPRHNPKGLFNFSFEFACGNKPLSGANGATPRPALVTMREKLKDRIDFAILNGDWLYERKRDFTASQWRKQVGISEAGTPRIVRIAPSIVGVWENYKDYLETDPNLAAWHREIPSLFVFDDHEILNDVIGTGEVGYRNRKAVFRDIGVKAWWDYLGWSRRALFDQSIHFGVGEFKAGGDVLRDRRADFTSLDLNKAANLHVHWGGQLAGAPGKGKGAGAGDPNAGVYEIIEILDEHRLRIRPAAKADKSSPYSIGRLSYSHARIANCDFFYLDTRSHRQLHDVKKPGMPGLTLLGKRQKAWLMENMRMSDADFLFVVSSVNLMIPHVGGTNAGPVRGSNKDEAWTTFLEEREQLIAFWDGLGKPVFVLTGDLHNSLAIQITDRVWEFASGPHSSGNHPATSEGGRPPNGPFQSGPRACEIRWSSYVLPDTPVSARRMPHYCLVQVNNVFRNPGPSGEERWVAFPRPHVVFQYYDGLTGELRYAESVFAQGKSLDGKAESPEHPAGHQAECRPQG